MAIEQKDTEIERIATQLRYLYEGPSWTGPSLKELIRNVKEECARQGGLPGAHSIWELVLHITAWLRIARERLTTSDIRDADGAEDWPGISGSWEDALRSLDLEVDALERAILRFPEERLDERAPANEPQTFYVLLHGVIQHTAYHAGQIALLKKRKLSYS